ncbi:MAG TPA: DUF983 domain-containing protein [Azospirillaceae bacterium]|nr:DUF983 domain-containing protein [Azospirillaceae bacterium]
MTTSTPLAQTPMGLGIRGLCPRCGKGSIFAGYLKLAPCCRECGLDLSFADPADGPAFFVMSIVSFPIVGLCMWLELSVGMALWLNLLVTSGLLVAASLLLLRPFKGWLVCSQYINKAEEARLDHGD